jgi:hypothetical protein
MEEEAREIIRNATRERQSPTGGLGSEIAVLFARAVLEEDTPEPHGHRIEARRSSGGRLVGNSKEEGANG